MRSPGIIFTISYRFRVLFGVIGAGSLSLTSWLTNAKIQEEPISNWPIFVAYLLKWLQSNTFPSFIIGSCFFILSIWLNSSQNPKDWRILQCALNKAQEIEYSDNIQDHKHNHRVTLFQYKEFAWCNHWTKRHSLWPWGKYKPWTGWLVPVLRSGHTAQKTNTVFVAPRKGGEAEGVCGFAWGSLRHIVVNDLVEVKPSSPNKRRLYAENTYCPKEFVDHLLDTNQKPAPRSIGAIPILVGDTIWGVLVFDSQDPNGVKGNLDERYRLTVSVIQTILEK